MAKKKRTDDTAVTSKPVFPYTNKPGSLRRFLADIPQRPKPTKVNQDCLKAWGLRDTNDTSVIRVLKAVGLVNSTNEPTDLWTAFMRLDTGPNALGAAIQSTYAPLFEHSHEPHRESDETLRNYFNIHSGGGSSTLSFQIQSFKALCDHASFNGSANPAPTTSTQANGTIPTTTHVHASSSGDPAIHIDLHIHLPENKSRRDYEYMFEDIARYILGRERPRDDERE